MLTPTGINCAAYIVDGFQRHCLSNIYNMRGRSVSCSAYRHECFARVSVYTGTDTDTTSNSDIVKLRLKKIMLKA